MADSRLETSVQEHIRSETKKNFWINLILNGVIAYATLHGIAELTTWGEHSYGRDLIITALILCTILSGIFIAVFRHKCKKEQIVPEDDEGQALAWLLPYSPWLAAPWMGIIGACLAVPPLLGLLAVFNLGTMTPLTYALIKGLWAGVLAAIVVPIAIRQGLRNADE